MGLIVSHVQISNVLAYTYEYFLSVSLNMCFMCSKDTIRFYGVDAIYILVEK